MVLGTSRITQRIPVLGPQPCFHLFSCNQESVISIIGGRSEMEHGFPTQIIDRVVANARVVRWAPEAAALVGIITFGGSYFAFQNFNRERVAALNDRVASQERLLADYRTRLKAAEEAAAQIEKLTSSLAETQKSLSEAKGKLASVEKLSRDSSTVIRRQ